MTIAKRNPLPSQERLKELFDYDPKIGLIWRPRPEGVYFSRRNKKGGPGSSPKDINKLWNGRCAGKRVGSPGGNDKNYYHTTIDGVFYKVYRLVWKYHYNVDPDVIDHINHDPLDNRIENLRNVSSQFNLSMEARNYKKKPHEKKISRQTRYSVSVPEGFYIRLCDFCKKQRISRRHFIRCLITKHIDTIPIDMLTKPLPMIKYHSPSIMTRLDKPMIEKVFNLCTAHGISPQSFLYNIVTYCFGEFCNYVEQNRDQFTYNSKENKK